MYYEPVFDFEAPRAKCLSFHPVKPILLSSHHTSHINAYDLHLASHVHTFLGHDGPVRAVLFHPKTDLFVSGGDDCKIILWSYSQKKIICTFSGHKDYIRSLDFHPTQPWILSSSDDQTIRIWNFQSQKLLASVSGHSHYVMCVRFVGHYIISCSLDQTLRVWDYSNLTLRKESSMFGVPNVVVKQIIDGHDRGINHIVTHDDKSKFLTCGDDRQVKMWEMGDTVWEKEAFYNHQGNVSGACFIKDNVVSVGEDGVISLGDKRDKFDTRFWCVAKNRDETLLAFGHDSGIKIFSTVKRGLIYSYDGSGIYYKTDNSILYNNLETEKELLRLKRKITNIFSLPRNEEGKYMNCYLIQENSKFEVFRGKESVFKGEGKGLLMNDHIIEMNKNDIVLEGNNLFSGEGVNSLIYYTPDTFFILKNKGVEIFSIEDRRVKASIVINDIEKIRIGKSLLAFIARRKITLLDKKLRVVSMIDEMIEITDGFFLEDVLFYSTMRHIKFTFNCHTGILRSIEKEVYLLFLEGNFIFYITKDGLENVNIDLTEYNLELAIDSKNIDEIHSIIDKGIIPIEIIVNRLIKNNLSDIALPFIKEKKGDFLFDINKLDECYENIKDNKDNQMFERLFEKSMKMKNYDVAENCLKKLGDHQRLLMLYACRNQLDKIEELKTVPDINIKLNVGVILNDKQLIVNILSGKNIIIEKKQVEIETSNLNKKVTKLSIKKNLKEGKMTKDESKHKIHEEIQPDNKISNVESSDELIDDKDTKSCDNSNKIINDGLKNKSFDTLEINSEENDESSDKSTDESEDNTDVKINKDGIKNFESSDQSTDESEENTDIKINEGDKKSIESSDKITYESENIIESGIYDSSDKINVETDGKINVDLKNIDSGDKITENSENKIESEIHETIDKINSESEISDETITDSMNKRIDEINSCSDLISSCDKLPDDTKNISDEDTEVYTDSVSSETKEYVFNKLYAPDQKVIVIKNNINLELIKDSMDYEKRFEDVISNTTEGKFTSAITVCIEIVHNIAYRINSNREYFDLRRNLGIYISGLSTEKMKKRVTDPERFLIMSSYFPSLNLQKVHKNLALSNFMILCYKNENYNQAKSIAKDLISSGDVLLQKNANKIMKSNKAGDKYLFKEGAYCYDVSNYCSNYKICRFCYVKSEHGEVCSVCGVGTLN